MPLAPPTPAAPLVQHMPQIPGQGTDPRQALLAQLHDVITPQAPTWWPPAPGWWAVALITLALAMFAIYKCRMLYLNTRYRAQALTHLRTIEKSDNPASQKTHDIMVLLKRTFFTIYPHSRDRYAGTYGLQWIALLQTTLTKPYNTAALETHIDTLLYRNQDESKNLTAEKADALAELYRFTRHWLKHHRRHFPKAQPSTSTMEVKRA